MLSFGDPMKSGTRPNKEKWAMHPKPSLNAHDSIDKVKLETIKSAYWETTQFSNF